MKKLIILVLAAVLAVMSSGIATAAWEPQRPIELVAPANPGGGWDMICRVVQKTLTDEKLVSKPIIVTNKPGGGGSAGWTYLRGKRGQGEVLAATSTLIMLNKLLGSSELTFNDFTPIAALQAEWISVAVEKNSPYNSIKELMAALKANPADIPVGVGPSLGNNDHLVFLQLAQSQGFDPAGVKFIVYPGAGAEIVPALLGGHIKATVIGLAEVLEQHKSGNLKIIGISAPTKADFLPDVASFKDQGIDLVFPHWRGFIGAPDMTAEQVAYWDGVFAKMVESKTWKEQCKNLGWTTFYQNSGEHKKFLGDSTKGFDELLTKVGLKK